MNIGQLLGKVAAFAKKSATAMKLPQSATIVDKINTTFGSKAVGTAAKKLGLGLITANLTDKYIKDVPVASNIYNWYATTLDEIYEKTVRQTPVVGDWLRKVTDFINKLIVPNAQEAIERNREMKHLNNPEWYTNAEMHTQFKIPFVYGDNRPLIFGSNIDTAAVCVMALGYNPIADRYAVDSRLNQLMDMLKGIRGLSGRLPYSKGDLFFYDLITKYIVNEYYKLKFALRLSKYYSLVKSRMPRNVMEEMGWDFDDFLANKALYITALTTIANFITNNVPCFGTQLEKIKSMWDCLVPDCNDGKVALFYKVYPVIDGYLPSVSNNTAIYERFGDKFYDFTPDKTANDPLAQGGKEYHMTYNTYITNLLSFINKMNNNDIFTNIKADIIGAFGKSAVWNDAKINEYDKIDGIIGKFDELYLTMIQNATIIDEHPLYRNYDGTSFASATPHDIYYTVSFGGVNSQGTIEMPNQWSGAEDNTYVGIDYFAQETSTNAGTFFFAATDGRSQGVVTETAENFNYTDNLSVISNKYNQSEGEDLEIIQFLAQEVGGNGLATVGTNETAHCKRHYMTNCFYVLNADILYHRAGNDYSVRLGSYFTIIANNTALYSTTVNLFRCAQFWSQSDYMSKLHLCTANSAGGLTPSEFTDVMLLDYNIMGSMSSLAFRQAIKYSTYSVYAANVKVTETKRASNIVGIYNIK